MPEDDERWVHPLLRKSAQQQEGEDGGSEESPESKDPSSPASPPADDAQQQLFDATASEAASSPYTLSREHLYADLRRLYDGDPHFRNVVKSMAGRAAQGERERESDAGRLAQLEAELHNARYQQAMAIVQSVEDDEEADQLYQSNPNFREAVDWIAENQPVDPRDLDENRLFFAAVDREFERALRNGLPPEAVDYYKQHMAPGGCTCNRIAEPHGFIDHDDNGNPLDPAGSISRLAEIVDFDLEETFRRMQAAAERVTPPAPGAPAAPPAAPPSATAPPPADAPRQTKAQEAASLAESVRSNPRIGQAVPDVTPGSGNRGTGQLTGEEVRGMTVQEILKRWPNPGDYTAAVERGEIVFSEV